MQARHFSTGALAIGLSLASSNAFAGSSTEPGFTTGIPLYTTALPTGLYMDLVPDASLRKTTPVTNFEALAPFLTLQTPYNILGGRLQFQASPVFAAINAGPVHEEGLYNTYFGSELNWSVTKYWSVGTRLAGWIPQGDPLAGHYGTIAPRIGATYLSPTAQFTASLERGFIESGNGPRLAPNYVNLDLTATRTTNKFEYGLVSFLSADTSAPYARYQRQSQAAIGPLLGYTFGKIQFQAKLTSDIYQHNYGGRERRLEFNIYIPLWTPGTPQAQRIPDR